VTVVIIITAKKMLEPSIQPDSQPSLMTPMTRETKAAARSIFSIRSSKHSSIKDMRVFVGLTGKIFGPNFFFLSSTSLSSPRIPYLISDQLNLFTLCEDFNDSNMKSVPPVFFNL